ncbi:hypothetical protein FKM82_024003 [Ascaphus truei]
MTERILDHTLEIIYLLTGEDYTVVKKHGEHVTDSSSPCVPQIFCRTQRPIMENPTNSLIHERNNDKKLMSEKILEHTNIIIHLLTGEVRLKCDDVAVYFSMEEWEYLEGHKEHYKDVMMENLSSLGSILQCPMVAIAAPFIPMVGLAVLARFHRRPPGGVREEERRFPIVSQWSH